MTATEWLTIMVVVLAVELLYLTGEALVRAFRRELDADTIRHIVAETTNHDFLYGGSAARGVETPLPAPEPSIGEHPGAGTELQAGDSRLDRDPAVTASSDGSQPAPAPPPEAGAGPQLRVAVSAPPDALPSGGPVYTPVSAGAPDPALTGPTRGAA